MKEPKIVSSWRLILCALVGLSIFLGMIKAIDHVSLKIKPNFHHAK